MIQLSGNTIKTVKLFVNSIFITFIIVKLIITAVSELPDNWLFFSTSGAVENFASASIAFALIYFVFKSRSILQRVSFIMLFVVVLTSIAILKDFRIHNFTAFEQSFEYFKNFLGQTLLFYLFLYLISKLDAISRYKNLERELHEAKEQLLRNHMHPHFLYNAFNSIYSLCLKNSSDAADYILKLSGMMRYLTDETHRSKVPLMEELDFIQTYIDIEKMRFGGDAAILLSTNGNISGDKLIEPFLLITLVENAFKHGFYTNSADAYVNISLNMKNNDLLFCVENSVFVKQHFQESERKGRGLDNLKQRLHLLYPKNSRLEIKNVDNQYTSLLKITLN